jgi:hypothetical protein
MAWNAARFVPKKRRVRALLIILTLSALSWSALIAITLAIWAIL